MRKEILHQYANSPKLVGLIDGLAEMLSVNSSAKDFYEKIFDIKQATGKGLDNWGLILDVPRSLKIDIDGNIQPYTMHDDQYRMVLLLKCAKNITNGSCNDIFKALNEVFGEQGEIYVSDLENMHIRYSFSFLLDEVLYAILNQTNVIPKPAGVDVDIYELPSFNIFGFNGQELSNFNNGTFFQGKRG